MFAIRYSFVALHIIADALVFLPSDNRFAYLLHCISYPLTCIKLAFLGSKRTCNTYYSLVNLLHGLT